ncbi:diacylglycerol kinase catalytic domain-containing protein [Colletotrichum orchidophilum]|uniref:Diacylglycerol kinase catalytic domain-containing protein n=1 Tax=Colletotrichum orchidophilum TaxID=1209926 RepID=A0A1G4B2Q8_9PEZI|nr:diacylglycerol kinase catalytic domain-containing protein [Colletotrichum orchidophilum]OHE95677.1 diacylglycerol kinase catalytic domain-containing protein [Colletotrichum orchidophilum]
MVVVDTAGPLGEPRAHGLVPRHARDAAFIDGKLVFTSQRGSESLRAEEILFIIPASSRPASGPIICALREDPEAKESPYQLDILLVEGELPAGLTSSGLLLPQFPDHLAPKSGAHDVHFIVSTMAGLGHAPTFWDGVVQPLLLLAGQKTSSGDLANTFAASEGLPASSQNGSRLPANFNVLVTENADSVRTFAKERWAARQAASSEASPRTETIILLSGDGGVVDLLNGCEEVESATALSTIALLPLGTGNACFHSLHQPLYTETGPSHMVLGIRTLFFGTPAPLPSFRASFSPGARLISYTADPGPHAPGDAALSRHDTSVDHLFGAIVASYGFHAQLVWESDTPEYRKHGNKRFGMVAQELLKESHAYVAAVEVRGPGGNERRRVERERFGYALAAIVSNLEKTFTIAPDSGPLQGRLKLVHFGAVGGDKTMEIMMAAYKQGSHVGMRWTNAEGKEDYVGYEDAEEIRVTIGEKDPRWRKVCIDGTIVEIPEGGWMAVETLERPLFRILADRSVL